MKSFLKGKAWLVASAFAALAVAGVAVAANGTASVSTITANFTATTVAKSHTATCTGSDGTYVKTHAVYTGTATGSADADLNGPVVVNVSSVYNSDKNLGWVNGNVRFNPGTHPRGDKAHLRFTAVNSGGTLQGFANGSAGHGQHVLGNLTSTFTSTGGFTAFSLGAGTATDTAIVTSGGCKPPHPTHPAAPHHANGPKHGPKHH
jgi:hypothetical protein